jgi:ATP-dependent helicase/nuclease subunit B
MNEIAKNHHATLAWRAAVARIRSEMARGGVHPAQTVVLVPYAQLMQEARNVWSASADGAHFLPRFETTQNWTQSLGGFEASGDDIRLDAAIDILTAATLLVRAGLAEHQTVLAPRLMEAAWSLAKVAAAVPPTERVTWGDHVGQALAIGMDVPVLALEAAVGRIALAWAANSSYASDLLFAAQPELLVVLEGFQTEPLAKALQLRLGERGINVSLDVAQDVAHDTPINAATKEPRLLALHATQDAEDEAQAAAACVLAHLAQGRSPVALVAVDRVLTRRVRAMLGDLGLAVRDETGWKLSTTRAAATLMSLLRACAWDASADAVLDWLKNAPAFVASAVTQMEIELRKAGVRDWRSVAPDHPLAIAANAIRDTLQRSRSLSDWLGDVRTALQNAGHWPGLATDNAGQGVLKALRLLDQANSQANNVFADFPSRLDMTEFIAWVSQTLEAESFAPTHPAQAQVVILPMSQLLGRAVPAVVLPGCDEVRLAVSPEPPGIWTPAQRELLGLPSREALASATRQAWVYALQSPCIDLLWRQSEGGERLMPSGFVQELVLQSAHAASAVPPDPRALRRLTAQACTMPRPQGDALPVTRLSASAYEDLRRCPYRFFALRQLKLQESDELDTELGKRDFGNWLHSLLQHFHEALKAAPALEPSARLAMINVAADQATVDLGLSQSEFLPFAAAWPRVRAGYLQWLATHEASGAVFDQGEVWKHTPLGAVTLVGKLDRVDRLSDGSALVMDYKTENRNVTRERIKDAGEDTQLAFYAALLHDDTLAAAYVNVGEKDATQSFAQPDIVALRDQLLDGIVDDMTRIADGAELPAMGEGKACDFCVARGLCRKDFWSPI